MSKLKKYVKKLLIIYAVSYGWSKLKNKAHEKGKKIKDEKIKE